jgi:Glucodextranase, domain B
MRLVRRSAWPVAACLTAVLALAGCGSAAPTGPPQVTLSLTAPTSGATVGVRTIQVAGTVAPAQSAVRIAGRRVRVRHGSFIAAIHLGHATTRIRVTARAHGFVPATVQTVVRFSARTAKGMLVARRDNTGGGTIGGASWVDFTVPFASSAGRSDFMSSCEGGDGTEAPACTCLYNHFVQSGAFSTRHGLETFYKQTVQAVSDQKVAEAPISLRSGLADCSSLIYQTHTGSSG